MACLGRQNYFDISNHEVKDVIFCLFRKGGNKWQRILFWDAHKVTQKLVRSEQRGRCETLNWIRESKEGSEST